MKFNFKKQKNIKVNSLTAIFCLLLVVGLSFYSGFMYFKNKNIETNPSSGTKLELVKNNKPVFDFFTMSFCPYGNQMEDILRPVYDLIGNKIEMRPRYIFDEIDDLEELCAPIKADFENCPKYVELEYVASIAECEKILNENMKECSDENNYIKSTGDNYYTSLHGRQEATQNIREICAWKNNEDKNKWWNFVSNINVNCNYENADICWEDQAKAANLDVQAIKDCFNNESIQIIEEELAFTNEKQVKGSPTLMINDALFPSSEAYKENGTGIMLLGKKTIKQEEYRTPNAIKEALCYAFKKSPKECSTILETPNVQGASTEGGCE
jgi:hypothetical protein